MDKRKRLGSEWVWVYELGYGVSEHAEKQKSGRMTLCVRNDLEGDG